MESIIFERKYEIDRDFFFSGMEKYKRWRREENISQLETHSTIRDTIFYLTLSRYGIERKLCGPYCRVTLFFLVIFVRYRSYSQIQLSQWAQFKISTLV